MAINDKTAGAGAFATAEYFRKKGAKHWAKAMGAKEEGDEDEAKMNFKYAHYAYGRFHKAMDAVDRHGAAAEEHDRMRDEILDNATDEDFDEDFENEMRDLLK